MPAAVLWDMDGTLVDTEPYWIATEFDLIESYGGSWSHEQALQLVGNALITSGRIIAEQSGIPLTPEEIVERLLDGVVAKMQDQVPWRPGARDLLFDLKRAGVPTALVTMSYRRFVDPMLAALPPAMFDAIVTGDVVNHGKPHPEPYLMAASLLGVEPGDCVAIEDSSTGTESAAAAGCGVLVVPHHVEVAPGPGRHFVSSLEDLSVADLSRLDALGAAGGAAPDMLRP